MSKFSLPEITFDRGSLDYVGICARRLGAERVFVVSDAGHQKIGWVKRGTDVPRLNCSVMIQP